jgi:beta-galactosidase
VDIVRPGAKLEGYRLVVAPSVFVLQPSVLTALKASVGLVVVGPRTGSKTQDFAIPSNLAPGELQSLLPVRVLQVETLRENAGPAISGAGMSGRVGQWREMLESRAPVLARYDDGGAAIVGTKRLWYVGCDGDLAFTRSMLREAALEAGLPLRELPDGIRLKRRGDVTFAFNYTDTPWPIPDTARAWLVGGPVLGSRDLAIWRNA